jgi:hypothetical protein
LFWLGLPLGGVHFHTFIFGDLTFFLSNTVGRSL